MSARLLSLLRSAGYSVAALALLALPTLAAAQSSNFNRVEEDWELIVGTPDAAASSPQIVFDMAPSPSAERAGLFLLNYRDAPSFDSGGYQVQIWEGDERLATNDFRAAALDTPEDRLTFTLFMERSNNQLRYGLVQGHGATWGDFTPLEVAVPSGSNHLNDYRASHSVDNATITLGATRVESLRLLEVRRYHADGSGFVTETLQSATP